MKTILGKAVIRFQFSKQKSYCQRISISGMIWLQGDFNIVIRNGKFFLQHKDGTAHGIILKGTEAHRKIKRMMGRCFQAYRKFGMLNDGTLYLRSRCTDGMHNVQIAKTIGLNKIKNKSNFLILAS